MMCETMRNVEKSEKVTTVLVVDDHAIWRGAVRSMLEDSEFTVVGEAASGREAVEVARHMKPRLVLLDIRMAGPDWLETLAALKQEHPQMAIVLLTTYDNPVFMARATERGAAGYLVKGVDREQLLTTLRATVQQSATSYA